MIVHGSYAKGTKRQGLKAIYQGLRAHLNYNQYRSRGQEEQPRQFFDRDGETTRQDIMRDFADHTGPNAAYHKVILSPSAEELRGIDDLREWTRDVMKDVAAKQGRELHWAAVVHENTDNPHVHVVIAGQTERADGREVEVRMYGDDYRTLRESGHDHSRDREPEYQSERAEDIAERDERIERLFGPDELEHQVPTLEIERAAALEREIAAPARAMEIVRDIGFER